MAPNQPLNKRCRPDIDIYYPTPQPAPPPPGIVHPHTAFETNSSGISHNHSYFVVPAVESAPLHVPDITSASLIHDMDPSNYPVDADDLPDSLPDLSYEEDEDDESDEYPYNWMDPGFVQRRAKTNTVNDTAGGTAEATPGVRKKRNRTLATVCLLLLTYSLALLLIKL